MSTTTEEPPIVIHAEVICLPAAEVQAKVHKTLPLYFAFLLHFLITICSFHGTATALCFIPFISVTRAQQPLLYLCIITICEDETELGFNQIATTNNGHRTNCTINGFATLSSNSPAMMMIVNHATNT